MRKSQSVNGFNQTGSTESERKKQRVCISVHRKKLYRAKKTKKNQQTNRFENPRFRFEQFQIGSKHLNAMHKDFLGEQEQILAVPHMFRPIMWFWIRQRCQKISSADVCGVRLFVEIGYFWRISIS